MGGGHGQLPPVIQHHPAAARQAKWGRGGERGAATDRQGAGAIRWGPTHAAAAPQRAHARRRVARSKSSAACGRAPSPPAHHSPGLQEVEQQQVHPRQRSDEGLREQRAQARHVAGCREAGRHLRHLVGNRGVGLVKQGFGSSQWAWVCAEGCGKGAEGKAKGAGPAAAHLLQQARLPGLPPQHQVCAAQQQRQQRPVHDGPCLRRTVILKSRRGWGAAVG